MHAHTHSHWQNSKCTLLTQRDDDRVKNEHTNERTNKHTHTHAAVFAKRKVIKHRLWNFKSQKSAGKQLSQKNKF